MGFACEEDARRVLDVLPKRFGKYGLTLHPDKTRLVPFRPRPRPTATDSGAGSQPGTFDLLGFTHYWGRSRQGQLGGEAADGRRAGSSRALRTIAEWCRLNRHRPIAEQHQTLSQKLRGHFAYYGITGNGEALRRFRDAVIRALAEVAVAPHAGRLACRGTASTGCWSVTRCRPPVVVHSVYRHGSEPVT